MQVTAENLSGLERKLNVVIPVERIENEIQTKLRKFALTAKMPGFRPGKIPLAVIQKRYGSSARVDAIENLIRETYVEAVKQEKLNPIGVPKIEVISANPNEPFSYSAVFEIYPEVNLADLSQVQVEKVAAKLTDEDLDEMLEKLRKERVQWQEITDLSRKAQAGDRLTVDFTVKVVADPAVEAKVEKNVKFVLGANSMWEDFEKQLYGVSPSEKKKYVLQFPQTHVDKELVGKDAEFEVEVRELHEPILPPLDDEFARKFSIKEGGLESLKAEVRKNMERELQTVLKNSFKNAMVDKLLESNSIEIPKTLVESELDQLARRWQERFASYQKTPTKTPEFPRQDFAKQAQRNVSLGLLLAAVLKENKIEVEPQELRAKIEELASVYDDATKMVEWYFSDPDRLSEIKSLLLEEKAIDHLASKINIIEKEIGYKDAVGRK